MSKKRTSGHHLPVGWRIHGGKQIKVRIFAEPGNIDGQDHIGRAGLTLGKKALRQSLRRINNLGPNPGLSGKGVKKRLQQKLLPVRIDIQLGCRRQGRAHETRNQQANHGKPPPQKAR